jgi:hypothetical protein
LTGAQGPKGDVGLNALIKTTSETEGINCANGGIKIETGLDLNMNNYLEFEEINQSETKYICNYTSTNKRLERGVSKDVNIDGFFVIPKGISSLILYFQGASGGYGGSATFVGDRNYTFGGGSGGYSYKVKLLLLNLNEGDTVSFDKISKGINSNENAVCYSCGYACDRVCSGGAGYSSENTNLYLNNKIIATISGAGGGGGARAGSGLNYMGNGGSLGLHGELIYLSKGIVELGREDSGGNSSLLLEY